MPNPIKYSTGTESQSIKKGNFYFGVGDVGKGPSESTGHYQGITPPLNGYTIYANDSGSFTAIYCANNDFQLINFTNGFSNQSFTAVTDCLNWYLSQPNYSCVNRDYESITTDGLLFCLDAGFTSSYPTSGVTWYDNSGSGNNGTSSTGLAYALYDGQMVTIRALQNIKFNNIANVNPTRPSTALQYNDNLADIYRILAYNLNEATGELLSSNVAVLGSDSSFNYYKFVTDLTNIGKVDYDEALEITNIVVTAGVP